MGNKQIAKEAKQDFKNNFKISVLICLLLTVITNITSLIKIQVLELALLVITPALSYGVIISFMKLYKKENVKIYDFITTGFKNFSKAWSIIFRKFLKILPQFLLFLGLCIVATFLTLPVFANLIPNNETHIVTIAAYSFIWAYCLFLVYMALYLIILYPKLLYYSFANYIMNDNDNSITAKEAVEKSKELMKNNRFKYFKLTLSYVGWYFLAAVVISIISSIISFIINSNIITYILSIILTPIVAAYVQTANVHFYESLKTNQGNNDNSVIEEFPRT